MGLKIWLARRLTIGGTARTIAGQYKWLREKKFSPNTPDKIIFNEIIILRFKFPNSSNLMKMVEDNRIKGLKDLVVETLSIEAGFKQNSIENQLLFFNIIEEELIKKGIPSNVI